MGEYCLVSLELQLAVLAEKSTFIVVVGHRDRYQRTDVRRINKPIVLSNVSFFFMLLNSSLCRRGS